MNTESIYVITKGGERVTVADNTSALALTNALMALDCTEPVSKAIIHGNRQELDVYEVCFLDKHIKALTLQDAEKVAHWALTFGCNKVSVEKISADKEKEEKKHGGKPEELA